jgi:Tfp pilus assembly protein PilX
VAALVIVIASILILALLDLVALRCGVDSRESSDPRTRTSSIGSVLR